MVQLVLPQVGLSTDKAHQHAVTVVLNHLKTKMPTFVGQLSNLTTGGSPGLTDVAGKLGDLGDIFKKSRCFDLVDHIESVLRVRIEVGGNPGATGRRLSDKGDRLSQSSVRLSATQPQKSSAGFAEAFATQARDTKLVVCPL